MPWNHSLRIIIGVLRLRLKNGVVWLISFGNSLFLSSLSASARRPKRIIRLKLNCFDSIITHMRFVAHLRQWRCLSFNFLQLIAAIPLENPLYCVARRESPGRTTNLWSLSPPGWVVKLWKTGWMTIVGNLRDHSIKLVRSRVCN